MWYHWATSPVTGERQFVGMTMPPLSSENIAELVDICLSRLTQLAPCAFSRA